LAIATLTVWKFNTADGAEKALANLQPVELGIRSTVIDTRSLQRTNLINLYLALGGGFEETPASQRATLGSDAKESRQTSGG